MKLSLFCALAAAACLLAPAPTLAGGPVDLDAAIKKATTPDDRLKEGAKDGKRGWWDLRHEQKLKLVEQGGWDLVFIGDSITQGWEGHGKSTWEKFYANRKALNLGYSGDRTEHVLWRFENGELKGLKPKAAVIMIGTNNTGHRNDPPEAIAAGVEAIVKKLRTEWPSTKLLLLGIFPRAAKVTDAPRANNDKANALIAKLADGSNVTFLDINDKMLEADGTLTREIMPDLLHPQAKGYGIWAESIEPTLKKLLGE